MRNGADARSGRHPQQEQGSGCRSRLGTMVSTRGDWETSGLSRTTYLGQEEGDGDADDDIQLLRSAEGRLHRDLRGKGVLVGEARACAEVGKGGRRDRAAGSNTRDRSTVTQRGTRDLCARDLPPCHHAYCTPADRGPRGMRDRNDGEPLGSQDDMIDAVQQRWDLRFH